MKNIIHTVNRGGKRPSLPSNQRAACIPLLSLISCEPQLESTKVARHWSAYVTSVCQGRGKKVRTIHTHTFTESPTVTSAAATLADRTPYSPHIVLHRTLVVCCEISNIGLKPYCGGLKFPDFFAASFITLNGVYWRELKQELYVILTENRLVLSMLSMAGQNRYQRGWFSRLVFVSAARRLGNRKYEFVVAVVVKWQVRWPSWPKRKRRDHKIVLFLSHRVLLGVNIQPSLGNRTAKPDLNSRLSFTIVS